MEVVFQNACSNLHFPLAQMSSNFSLYLLTLFYVFFITAILVDDSLVFIFISFFSWGPYLVVLRDYCQRHGGTMCQELNQGLSCQQRNIPVFRVILQPLFCISGMADYAAYSFMYLLYTYIFSLEKYLFKYFIHF